MSVKEIEKYLEENPELLEIMKAVQDNPELLGIAIHLLEKK